MAQLGLEFRSPAQEPIALTTTLSDMLDIQEKTTTNYSRNQSVNISPNTVVCD